MLFKPCILFLVTILSQASVAADGDDVKDISLLTTSNYNPRDEQGRSLKAFFSGIGIALVGPGKNLKKEILDKMNQEALKAYFPSPAERDRIAQGIADGMKSRYLQYGYTNRNIIGALRFATSELIVTVMKRVLEREGLKDSKRAGLWSGKILASYHACMNVARTYKEGGKCGSSVEGDLIKNMGLAMSYELTRQEFGASYATPRPKEFAACVKARQPGANERVKQCAFQGVKNAAKTFGRARILEVAKKEVSPATADKIVAKVLPDFEKCLNATKERSGFVQCGDKLVAAAGSELAAEAILADARVATFFPKVEDRKKIADIGKSAFARCMNENEAKKYRDSNGTLRTDNCELFVKMETARSIASEVLRANVEKNMIGAPTAERNYVQKESSEALNRCWNSNKPESENALCVRKVAKRIAVSIAKEKLGRELPKDVLERDPKFRDRILSTFDECLEERLPKDIFTNGSGADTAAESCAGEVYRQAALQVAESKVRAALARVADQIPSGSAMDALIDSFVKTAFSECLGAKPDTAQLESCSLKLQKNVASSIAQALLPFKVDEFFRKGGGLEAYGMNQEKRQALLDSVIAGHKNCLKKTVKSIKSDESEKEVNACFKLTIRDLALRLSSLEFERLAKANGIDIAAPPYEKLKASFDTDFGACLDEKNDSSITLDEYLKNLEPCQAKLTKSITVKMAKAELSKTVSLIFSDASTNQERDKLETILLASFETCMDKTTNSATREGCVQELKSEATLALARSGVEARALKDFSELPAEIKQFATELERCVANGKAQECTQRYVKNSTIVLGKKIMHKAMKSELKNRYDALAPKMKALEEGFEACVIKVNGVVDQKFLSALDTCGTKLTESSFEFLLDSMPGSEPAKVAKGPSDKELADMMSRSMLCLNGQLSPDSESSLENLDPESMEAELLKMIGGYVSYDLKAAQGNFEQALATLGEDLKAAGPETARRNLLSELVKNGMVDQLLRSMIRGELERSINALPEEKRPPAELKAALLEKASLEKMLNAEVIEKARPIMTYGVLEPVLVEGKTLRSSSVLRSIRVVKNQSIGAILSSPSLEKWQNEPALTHLRDALK